MQLPPVGGPGMYGVNPMGGHPTPGELIIADLKIIEENAKAIQRQPFDLVAGEKIGKAFLDILINAWLLPDCSDYVTTLELKLEDYGNGLLTHDTHMIQVAMTNTLTICDAFIKFLQPR